MLIMFVYHKIYVIYIIYVIIKHLLYSCILRLRNGYRIKGSCPTTQRVGLFRTTKSKDQQLSSMETGLNYYREVFVSVHRRRLANQCDSRSWTLHYPLQDKIWLSLYCWSQVDVLRLFCCRLGWWWRLTASFKVRGLYRWVMLRSNCSDPHPFRAASGSKEKWSVIKMAGKIVIRVIG